METGKGKITMTAAALKFPIPKSLIIAIDSREQLPYRWDNVTTIVKKLDAGDYSVVGLENRVGIERKSLADAYGTFGSGRKRFERELERLATYEYAAVMIEATMEHALTCKPEHANVQQFTGKHFNRAWIAWSQRHRVHFVFAGSRALAQKQTYIMLERFWRDVKDGKR